MPPATWCRWGGPAADWSDVDQSDDALTVTGGGLRTVSLDEIHDGGYGVGSAAPIEDGAVPLGHPSQGMGRN